MTTNVPLLTKRVGLAATAITGYATAVYFSILFMSQPGSENNTNADKNTSSHSSTCTCYTKAPNRTDTFQNLAQVYDDQISRDEFVMALPLLRRSLLYFHAKGSVLEVGAGTGRNLDYYPQRYIKEVVLTDTSDQMLLKARDKIIEQNKKNSSSFFGTVKNKGDDVFKAFVADAKTMTKYYKENTFDTIVSTFTLCSFDDPVEVLRELQTVCKEDGKILLLEHGRSKSFDGLSNYLDRYAERHAKNWGCVWNRDLDDIVDKAGLEIESIHTWHFGTTYYIVCRPSLKVKEERKLMKALNLQQEQKAAEKNETNMNDRGIVSWGKRIFHRGK